MRFIKRGDKISPNHPSVLFQFKRDDIFLPESPIVNIQYIDSRLYDKPLIATDELTLLIEGDASFPDKVFLSSNPTQHTKGSLEDGDLRHVYQYVGKSSNLPIRAGLTVHCGKGGWSSTPHQFEKEYILSPKPMWFREQFAYLTYPKAGWGVQVRTGHLTEHEEYGHFINDVRVIADKDVLSIPLGSHPVSGGVGYQAAYFWCYECPHMALMEKFEDG